MAISTRPWGEAAFMTGMERNSDLVIMSSYAPLFANPEWLAWNPNLIVFNSAAAYGTPSYYNQMLFATNRPDTLLPIDLKLPDASDLKARKPFYVVAGKKDATGEIIIKAVNITAQPEEATIQLTNNSLGMSASATVLTSRQPTDENSFDHPTQVSPKNFDLGQVTSPISYTFEPYSITVIHLKP
jgi:alpha-N-arabinofuranosidase